MKRDSIITVKVRMGERSFLVTDVAATDKRYPALEKILENQQKPVY